MQLSVFPKTMDLDSVLPNEQDNCRSQKFTDQELEKLLQDLNEFQKTLSTPDSSEGTNIRDLLDSFFTNNMNYPNLSHPTPYQLSSFLHDFDKFEKEMLPPCQRDSPGANYLNNDHTEIQESQVMIDEMAEGTQQWDIGEFHDATQSMGMTADLSTFDNVGGVSFQGGSGVTFFGNSANVIRYFHCTQTSSEKRKPYTHRRKKRRYKGVIETEEETALRQELTKIKNREAAAKAHEKKLAHEAHLKTQLSKLHKKNKFLTNLLMFLEGHKRIEVSPKPLRRTISGLV